MKLRVKTGQKLPHRDGHGHARLLVGGDTFDGPASWLNEFPGVIETVDKMDPLDLSLAPALDGTRAHERVSNVWETA